MTKTRDGINPFEQSPDSLTAADAQIYGQPGPPAIITGRIVARPLNIYELMPDPTQPRRAVPSQVMDTWNRSPETVGDMLATWWQLATDEAGFEIPVAAHLQGEETERSTSQNGRDMGVMERGFMDLVELAASIRRDGLIEPIMVAPTGNGLNQIVVGERRWLAHHLLADVFRDDDAFRKIAAVTTDKADVWKQAAENNNRVNLNAIGKARQLALLLMAVYAEQGHSFQPYEAFDYDREFYAQVADGGAFPIPYGAGERIVQAMGLKHNSQLRQFRALLRLPDHYWRIGDDQDWTENRLRDYLKEMRESVTVVTHLAQDADKPVTTVTHVAPDEEPAAESITTVIDSPPIDSDEEVVDIAAPVVIEETPTLPISGAGSKPTGMAETPKGNPGGLPDWAVQALETAYVIAKNNPPLRSWFNAMQVKLNPASVNVLVNNGYLDCRNPGNMKYDVAAYRINAVGAQTINRQPIDFSEVMPPAPYPAGEPDVYAGAYGNPKTADQLPPRQTLPPASPARRVGKVVQGADRHVLENILNMTVQSVAEDPLEARRQVEKGKAILDAVDDYLDQMFEG